MKLKYVSYLWIAMVAIWGMFVIVDMLIGDGASAQHDLEMTFLCLMVVVTIVVADDIKNHIDHLKRP